MKNAPIHALSSPSMNEIRVARATNAILLAMAGGYLDAFAWVGHGHVFANAMTGNVVLLGVECANGNAQAGLNHLPPILTFMVGVLAARGMNHSTIKQWIRNPWLSVLVLELAILAVLSLLPLSTPNFWITTSIAFAASMQVETFRNVEGHSYNSTFTTGNLRTFCEGLFDWLFAGKTSESARITRNFALICIAFLLGATIGGFLTPSFGNHTLWGEMIFLLIVAVRITSLRR